MSQIGPVYTDVLPAARKQGELLMSSIMAFFYSATFYVLQRTDKNMPVGETRKVVGVSRTYGRSACVWVSRVLASDYT